MSKALDELPLSTSAFLSDTLHLSLPQVGAYLLILMTMWRAGGWIPDDEKKIAMICRLSVAKWRLIAADIMALLLSRDGKLSQKRLLSEIETVLKTVTQNRINGAAGGKAKALKNKEADVATANISAGDRQPVEVNAIPSSFKESHSSESQKKVSSRGSSLPIDWVPTEADYAYGVKQGITRPQVDACGEDMRLWARGNANRAVGRKADWTSTFHSWMRREAPKLIKQNGGINATDRNDVRRAGFAGIAARVRYSPAGPERPGPEDLEPINRR